MKDELPNLPTYLHLIGCRKKRVIMNLKVAMRQKMKIVYWLLENI